MSEPRDRLHAAVVDLRDVLADAADDERWFDRVRVSLAETLAALRTHAGDTEAGDGLLAGIVDEEPAFGPRVAEMRREHRALLEHCAALLERSRGPVSREELHDAASRLVMAVDRHHHRSTELLMDAYQLDLPAVD